jgi:hypothetical protein
VAESSAETSEVGMRNKTAERRKKKISSLPNNAEAGRFFILSIPVMMRRTKEKREIFLVIVT